MDFINRQIPKQHLLANHIAVAPCNVAVSSERFLLTIDIGAVMVCFQLSDQSDITPKLQKNSGKSALFSNQSYAYSILKGK